MALRISRRVITCSLFVLVCGLIGCGQEQQAQPVPQPAPIRFPFESKDTKGPNPNEDPMRLGKFVSAKKLSADDGATYERYQFYPSSIVEMCAYPTGTKFALALSANKGCQIAICDIATREIISRTRIDLDFVFCLKVAPDGKRIAAVDDGDLVLLDGETGEILQTMTLDRPYEFDKFIFVGNDRLISPHGPAWINLTDMSHVVIEGLEDDSDFAVSVDGQMLAYLPVEEYDHIAILNPEDLAEMKRLSLPDAEVFLSGEFSPDGSMFAALDNDAGIWVWDVETGELLLSDEYGGAGAWGLMFGDSGRLVSCGDEEMLRFWSVADKKSTGPLYPNGGFSCATMFADGKYTTSGDWLSGQLHV